MASVEKIVLVISINKDDCDRDFDCNYPDTINGKVRTTGHPDSTINVKFYRIPDDVALVGPDDHPHSAVRFDSDGRIGQYDHSESAEPIGFKPVERDPNLLYYYAIMPKTMKLVTGSESIPYGLDFCQMATHRHTMFTIEGYEICYPQKSTVLPTILSSGIKSYVAHHIPDALTLRTSQLGMRTIPFTFTYWTTLVPCELDAHMTTNKTHLIDDIEHEKKEHEKKIKAYKAKLAWEKECQVMQRASYSLD